ncbi:MAG: hypothetical protein QNJ38_16110 [Prochloraceae cyanobacterium]|nr:hypothetical protein [Prochloraceae cyanobacterium]
MTRSREPEEKEFRGVNGFIYVVGIFIGAIAALLTALAQMGSFSPGSSKQVSTAPGNTTLELPQKNIFQKKERVKTVQVGDLTATLQGCQRFDKELLCSVLLTNTKASTKLIVFNNYQRYDRWHNHPLERIRILDFHGNEYTSEKVQVGNLEGENFVKNQTIEDVGIRIVASFPEVPSKIQKLAAIAIPLKLSHEENTDSDVIQIHLRDIKISR